jgi:hypothetical protein
VPYVISINIICNYPYEIRLRSSISSLRKLEVGVQGCRRDTQAHPQMRMSFIFLNWFLACCVFDLC